MDRLKEECGVVGIWDNEDAANLCYLCLYALQHRGQEGCGIVTIDQQNEGSPALVHAHKGFGLVSDSFQAGELEELQGRLGIGHVRYSTQGGRRLENVQPFCVRLPGIGPVALAHNGNITNAAQLREELEHAGSIFTSSSDTEVILHLLARTMGSDLKQRLQATTERLKGAFSLVLLTSRQMFAVRDPYGFRPLVLGKKGDSFVVTSESCALDLIDADFLGEIEPGELVEICDSGCTRTSNPTRPKRPAFCAFEPIYFARPDSLIFGHEVYASRKKMGGQLALEAPADADVVIAVPDSGVPMAMGFAEQAGLPVELGLVRNHYVGRTFIQPSQEIRDFGVKLKLNPVKASLAGKRVVVVDDSLVRGTTSVKIIRMLRKAEAAEIHIRIGSPPITHSCFYGVDTPSRGQLLAAQKNVHAIRELLGADSLAFLSVEGLQTALGPAAGDRYCFACFNGRYLEETFQDIPKQPTDADGPGLRSYASGTPMKEIET